jgi:dihydrofolate reductase
VRNVVVTEFVTLDGVMDAPNEWAFPYWNDGIAKFKYDELFASDALLLGRVTFEGFAAAWPGRTDEQGFGDRMNSIPKYVASTTISEMSWNNSHLLKGDVAAEIAKLKQQPGQDILVEGSSLLVQTLIKHDLVDVYRLLVYPLVRGKGTRLFQDGADANLKLVEAAPFASGVVGLIYQPDRKS